MANHKAQLELLKDRMGDIRQGIRAIEEQFLQTIQSFSTVTEFSTRLPQLTDQIKAMVNGE